MGRGTLRKALALVVTSAVTTLAKRSLLGGSSVKLTQAAASSTRSRPDVPEGYRYDGLASKPSALDPGSGGPGEGGLRPDQQERPEPGFHTVLITRDGHRFTKPLVRAPHNAEGGFGQPHIPTALKRPHGRDLLQSSEGASTPGGAEPAPQAPAGNANATTTVSAHALASVYSDDYSCVGCSGQDTRTRVADTAAFPYSAVGRFMGQLADSNSALECSGTLIGSRHVLTAAHCVFDIHGTRKKVVAMDFAPCQNGPTPLCGTYEASNLRLLTLFTNEPEYDPTAINYDFALITLKADAGLRQGYLGIERGTGVSIVNLQSMGYPADKPTGTMWQVDCNGVTVDNTGNSGVFRDVSQCSDERCANILQHNCTASEGQSGASMFSRDTHKINAVLTGKLSTNSGKSYYVGTKLDAFVFDTLNAWYTEDANSGAPSSPVANAGGGGGSSAAGPGGAGGGAGPGAGSSGPGGGAGAFPGTVGGASPPPPEATASATLDSEQPAGTLFGSGSSGSRAATQAPPPPPTGRAPGLFGIFGLYARAPGGLSFQISQGEPDDPDALFFNPLIVKRTRGASLARAPGGAPGGTPGGAAATGDTAREMPF